MNQGKQGGPTNGIEYSPASRRRRSRKRRTQERKWAAMASPVIITYRDREANHDHG